MKSVRQIWEETALELSTIYDSREAKGISKILLEDVFGVNQVDFLLNEKSAINQRELRRYVDRLLSFEPIQYVVGSTDFFGRKFKIEKEVLIPRPETEELVRLIIEQNDVNGPTILDVGTGSGCIAISLALELATKAFGIDISEKILDLARTNASDLGAAVEFFTCDILENDPNVIELDIVVSNPPYIPIRDKARMHENVLLFEPEDALFVPDTNPLVFYRRILEIGKKTLKTGGKLYFELHENHANEVMSLAASAGYLNVRVHRDMQGKDRMLSAINSASK